MGSPINQKTAAPEELPVEIEGERVCVTINRKGKLFLVAGEPLLGETLQAQPVWRPVPISQCELRRRDDGSFVFVVEYGHHCYAIGQACGIGMDGIRRLNREYGDCTMLHPGDELVIREAPGATDVVSLNVEEIPYDDPEFIAMEGRILLGVARCTSYSYNRIKLVARIIAEEAWRNRGSDDWTAQLGDGRLTVHRTFQPISILNARRPRRARSPVCQLIDDHLERSYPTLPASEPLAEGTFEALRHAIADMLHACERYAIAEREADKIAQAAVLDGVRSVHELPAYRARYFRYNYDHEGRPEVRESEAYETECFAVPDGSYLADWNDHRDKDQLYNEQQIDEADAQLEAIKKWGVAICDIATSAGASVAFSGGATAKEFVIEGVKETLGEVAKLAAKKGAAELSRASVNEKASARQKIIADFRSKAIELIPTGPCSLLVGPVEFAELQVQMEQALAELETGADVEALDAFGEDVRCNIYSTNTVIAKRDPDPNRDATELRLDASDAFSPLATVEYEGEKYYVVQGTRGRGTQVVGGLVTAERYNRSENRGHAFVPASAIDATDSCQDLPDVTGLYAGAARPQDLIGREIIDLNLQEVPDAYTNDDCKFSMAIDEDRLDATDLIEIARESAYASFNVFRLCETHEGSSCQTVPGDNEFVITHYDRINRRVYVKSLDDDGKPEGWLMRVNLSVRSTPRVFGLGRELSEPSITEFWVDPNDFNPESVTDGSFAFGDSSMCLPSQDSQ